MLYFVLIADAPKLTCNESQTVMENIPFTLSCIVEGFPIATLTFYKEGEEVKLQDKLRRKDGGFYTIKASNSQQTVTSQINITVICKSLLKKQNKFPLSQSHLDVCHLSV